jgi:hypothetical protein
MKLAISLVSRASRARSAIATPDSGPPERPHPRLS